jgi:hypothetical protein
LGLSLPSIIHAVSSACSITGNWLLNLEIDQLPRLGILSIQMPFNFDKLQR